MPTTKAIGNRGEDIASVYLQQQGFTILQRNWKTRWCEIDIVATKNNCVYFVEVKFRSSGTYGEGYDYVTAKKQQQMMFAAEMWQHSYNTTSDMRLVVASISGAAATTTIELFEL